MPTHNNIKGVTAQDLREETVISFDNAWHCLNNDSPNIRYGKIKYEPKTIDGPCYQLWLDDELFVSDPAFGAVTRAYRKLEKSLHVLVTHIAD